MMSPTTGMRPTSGSRPNRKSVPGKGQIGFQDDAWRTWNEGKDGATERQQRRVGNCHLVGQTREQHSAEQDDKDPLKDAYGGSLD